MFICTHIELFIELAVEKWGKSATPVLGCLLRDALPFRRKYRGKRSTGKRDGSRETERPYGIRGRGRPRTAGLKKVRSINSILAPDSGPWRLPGSPLAWRLLGSPLATSTFD